MTVLLVVILVPIVVFATTSFVSNSLVRYTTQNRNMKAMYLAQAGIHRAIYNIKSSGTIGVFPVTIGSDTIAVTELNAGTCRQTGYQLKSVGTSVASSYPTLISRTVSAEYEIPIGNVKQYTEGSTLATCCGGIWWPFSEGTGYSTGTAPYAGTLTPSTANGPAWVADRKGVAARALSFNAAATTNYVTVPDSAGLDLISAGTLMAWIYIPSALGVSFDGTGIVHKGNSTTNEPYGLIIRRQNASKRFIRMVLRSSNGGTQRVVTGTTVLPYNTWLHVAGSWGALGMRVYLNGAVQASNATVYASYANANALTIGVTASATANTRFRGTIDEVFIYNCQKTDAEILTYYNATKP